MNNYSYECIVIAVLLLLSGCFSSDTKTTVNSTAVASNEQAQSTDQCNDEDTAILNWRSRCFELLNSKQWCDCFERNYHVKMLADKRCNFWSETVTGTWQNAKVQVKCGTPQDPR